MFWFRKKNIPAKAAAPPSPFEIESKDKLLLNINRMIDNTNLPDNDKLRLKEYGKTRLRDYIKRVWDTLI